MKKINIAAIGVGCALSLYGMFSMQDGAPGKLAQSLNLGKFNLKAYTFNPFTHLGGSRKAQSVKPNVLQLAQHRNAPSVQKQPKALLAQKEVVKHPFKIPSLQPQKATLAKGPAVSQGTGVKHASLKPKIMAQRDQQVKSTAAQAKSTNSTPGLLASIPALPKSVSNLFGSKDKKDEPLSEQASIEKALKEEFSSTIKQVSNRKDLEELKEHLAAMSYGRVGVAHLSEDAYKSFEVVKQAKEAYGVQPWDSLNPQATHYIHWAINKIMERQNNLT